MTKNMLISSGRMKSIENENETEYSSPSIYTDIWC